MKETLLVALALLASGCEEPGRWGAPVKLAPAGGINTIHTSPQVAAAGRGEAMALWQEPLDRDGTRHGIRFSTYAPDRGWHSPETIAETGPYPDSDLAMNAAGEAALALSDWPSSLSVLRFVRGRGWSESRRSFEGGPLIGGGQVAIGEDGTVAVTWVDVSHQPPLLYVSRFSSPAGWGSDDAISSSREPAYHPSIGRVRVSVDARGNAIATWVETVIGDYEYDSIWTNRAEKGARWGSPQRLEENIDFRDAELAANKEGEAILAWRRDDLRVSRFRDGIWAAPESIAPRKRSAFRSQPAIGDSGDALVLWLNWDEGGDEPMAVEAVRFDRGAGWHEPHPLPIAHARVSSIYTDVPGGAVIDRHGNATVVWNGEAGLVAYRYEVGRGWGLPQVIGAGYSQSEVKLAVDDIGNVVVIWTAPDGTWVNRFETSPR